MTPPVVVWFRNDLRLADHPALSAAAVTGAPIVALYVLDELTDPLGGASRWWLHHALQALAENLRSRGLSLILRRGGAAEELPRIVAETGATAVYWNRRYDARGGATDALVEKQLRLAGVMVHSFASELLAEPSQLTTEAGTPFKVFTPFWNALQRRGAPAQPLPSPKSLRSCAETLPSDPLAAWKLTPTSPDWAGGLRKMWTPGERAGLKRLTNFVDDTVAAYVRDRDRPGVDGTSGLSAFLRFGEVSPRQVWHVAAAVEPGPGRDAFLRQLGWREFSHHLLHHFPALLEQPFRREFTRFPWASDPHGLKAWQRGRTGYPVVDAGMRQLWTTGWMHNRVRMITASFLTKHLRLPWQTGAAWFLDTLVDADPANNAANWQWVAGCGTDTAPYFRIMNPVLQGQKFDPEGVYVRTWVPELEHVPDEHVHEPWLAPRPPADYAARIVDHGAARTAALAAYRSVR